MGPKKAEEDVPVRLRPVSEVAPLAGEIVAEVATELRELVPDCNIEHIGATALPDGVTKGDVDVNIRVPSSSFGRAVEMLTAQFAVAQPQNWTQTYASFSDPDRALPLGLQVTVIGSPDDFLVKLRDLMRNDPLLRRDYDRCKTLAAQLGGRGYWEAKNRMLQDFLRRHGVPT